MLRASLTQFQFLLSYDQSIPPQMLLGSHGKYQIGIRDTHQRNWYVDVTNNVIYLPEDPGSYPYSPGKRPPSQEGLADVIASLQLFDKELSMYYSADKDSIQFLKIE